MLGGEKTPDYVRYLPLLHSLFPWVKSIHIIRDGRDVALSTLQWATKTKGPGRLDLWDECPVGVCALWWKRQVQTGLRDALLLRPNTHLKVSYEDLIKSPEDVLRLITNFLELPFAYEMLEFNKGKIRHTPGLSAKKAWLSPTLGLRDWRNQMDGTSIELFESLSGDLLSELGYTRLFHTISGKVRQTADGCRSWWEDNVEPIQHKESAFARQVHIQPQLLAGE